MTARHIARCLALGWALASNPSNARTIPAHYPIAPHTLRVLVAEADAIVTARVSAGVPTVDEILKAGERKRAGTDSEREPDELPLNVILTVERVLKGDLATRTLEQRNFSFGCPEPARFEPGRSVLVFLERDEVFLHGAYGPYAASYGTKTLDEEAMNAYVARIQEQIEIDGMPDCPERIAAQVETLVKCAEHPATRWEGACELLPLPGIAMRGDEKEHPRFGRYLTPEQKSRLIEVLLAREWPRVGQTSECKVDCQCARCEGNGCLEELLADTRDPRLLSWLVQQFRDLGSEGRQRLRLAGPLLARIERCDGRPEVSRLRSEYVTQTNRPGRERVVAELLALYD